MSRRVVILGAGGLAREVLDIYEALQQGGEDVEVVGFVVEQQFFEPGTTVNGYPVLGGEPALAGLPAQTLAIGAVGDPRVRKRLVAKAAAYGIGFDTAIHPDATTTPRTVIGVGCVLMAGSRSSNAVSLGRHVLLNPNSTIGHDSSLADFTTVLPGANVSGFDVLNEGVTVGAGAVILPRIEVGAWATVGAGAVVTRAVEHGQTVTGVPARPIDRRP